MKNNLTLNNTLLLSKTLSNIVYRTTIQITGGYNNKRISRKKELKRAQSTNDWENKEVAI